VAGRLHGPADRQQAKASAMERMGGIGDLDLVRQGYVAFSTRGISLGCRSKGSTGAIRSGAGGRNSPAELWQGDSDGLVQADKPGAMCLNRLCERP
jgi:hypothetical protein